MILTFIIWLASVSFVGAILYVLGTYLVFAYDRRISGEHLTAPKLPSRRKAWAVMREIIATWIFAVAWPFGFIQERLRLRKGLGIPIILIHGFNHNRTAWLCLRRRLARVGFGPIYAPNLPKGNHTITEHAEWVAAYAKKLEQITAKRGLILIGHSMGGLVACHCAERLLPKGKVTLVITLGSPLHGTRMAVLAGSHAAHDMRVASPFTEALSRAVIADHVTRYFHLASWFDNIIIPSESALTGKKPGHERMFDDIGHLTILYSRRVARQVIDWLRGSVPIHSVPVSGLHRNSPAPVSVKPREPL